MVEVEKMGAQGYAYLQPNFFSAREETHGLLENGYTYEVNHLKKNQTFEAPSDWTISFMFNYGMQGGDVIINSRV